jgi:D-beta-D-heptose 7-phosphate kinase / D-beta-D-heptose 1-phosphate adenosyltransferase
LGVDEPRAEKLSPLVRAERSQNTETAHSSQPMAGRNFMLPDTLSVLVIGDLLLDEYLHGTVSRIAFDRPIPIVRTANRTLQLGGAANVAANLARLGSGVKVQLVGVVGDDQAGDQLQKLVSITKRISSNIQVVPGRPTTHKCRVVAQMDQHLLRLDTETTEDISAEVEDAIMTIVNRHLLHVRGIVCSDYAKGTLSASLVRKIIRAAREREIPVLIDPKGTDLARYADATILKPNLHELSTLTMCSVDTLEAVHAASRKMLEQSRAQAVIVTRGEHGANIYSKDGQMHSVKGSDWNGYTFTSTPLDVTGAGDSLLAAMALAYLNDISLLDSTQIGCVAAGLAVSQQGTAVVDRAQLESALLRILHPKTQLTIQQSSSTKVAELTDLLRHLSGPRSLGARVVFTNGCFDLLHVGHIQSLEMAKAKGDILIVGLNSDKSVADLKGCKRPIITEEHRARCLSALACVDFVTIFTESTPLSLIEAIRPDILVKGTDYTAAQVVGREFVESYGGRVELLPLLEGVSTTKILTDASKDSKICFKDI